MYAFQRGYQVSLRTTNPGSLALTVSVWLSYFKISAEPFLESFGSTGAFPLTNAFSRGLKLSSISLGAFNLSFSKANDSTLDTTHALGKSSFSWYIFTPILSQTVS